MSVYNIQYSAANMYEPSLGEALLEFLILPLNSDLQRTQKVQIKCKPEHNYYYSKNFYNFQTIRVRLKTGTTSFQLKLESRVEKDNVNHFQNVFLPLTSEHEILSSMDFRIQHYFFLTQSDYTSATVDWQPPIIRKNESVFDFTMRVNELVNASMAYNMKAASVNNNLDTVINSCEGVCQDFAHFMIAIMRENNIPARYVSGYLNLGKEYNGTGSIHAWVEVLIPGTGWIGFDPTNNLLEDHHYIKIAHGRDLSECSSLIGVVKSATNNSTGYEVKIKELSHNYSDQ